jgi:hypothetical protein
MSLVIFTKLRPAVTFQKYKPQITKEKLFTSWKVWIPFCLFKNNSDDTLLGQPTYHVRIVYLTGSMAANE